MKLIDSKAELLIQSEGLKGIYKQIELCGRTCYKSEDRITEDSSRPFVARMIASKHLAVLEHGTVYLQRKVDYSKRDYNEFEGFFTDNPYSQVNYEAGICLVTTNLRVIIENNKIYDLKYSCEPTEYHIKRYTIKFITDRGVMAELTRHRAFSFSIESTRYCNYSKDKFGGEIIFIIPSWLKDTIVDGSTFSYDAYIDKWQSSEDPVTSNFLQSIAWSEKNYLVLLQNGKTPQEARQVLPNALKTEICMTGFVSDWKHFFDLRLFGKTGKPHPDMELLVSKAKEEFRKANLWDSIMVL